MKQQQFLWAGTLVLSLAALDTGASSLGDWAKNVKDKTVAAAREAASAPLDAIKNVTSPTSAPAPAAPPGGQVAASTGGDPHPGTPIAEPSPSCNQETKLGDSKTRRHGPPCILEKIDRDGSRYFKHEEGEGFYGAIFRRTDQTCVFNSLRDAGEVRASFKDKQLAAFCWSDHAASKGSCECEAGKALGYVPASAKAQQQAAAPTDASADACIVKSAATKEGRWWFKSQCKSGFSMIARRVKDGTCIAKGIKPWNAGTVDAMDGEFVAVCSAYASGRAPNCSCVAGSTVDVDSIPERLGK